MRRTATSLNDSSDMGEAITMDVLSERLDVLDRRRGENAMSQIEDVPWLPVRSLQHIVGCGQHAIERCQQDRGIQIALNGAIVPDALPRLIQWDAPVGADDITTRFAHIAKNGSRSSPEMNGRHAE